MRSSRSLYSKAFVIISSGALISWHPPLVAGPPSINHQGFVTVNEVPFNGVGEFRFAIVDPDSGLNGWTNDGSALFVSDMPATSVEIPVVDGLYSVRLGDATEFNMPPIPSEIFSDENLVLRVWFDDGVNGLRQLVPDHALSSAPYAFRSVSAELAEKSLDGVPSGFAILSETTEAPSGYIATTLQIRAGDAWLPRRAMPTPRTRLAAGVVNNRIYAIGGINSSTPNHDANEEYDPATNTWRVRARMPTGRADLAIGVVADKIYAIGGNATPFDQNEEYDPATDMWESKAPMPTARGGLGVGVVRGKIYAIGGGIGFSGTTVNEEYDPSTNTWDSKKSLPIARRDVATGVISRRFIVLVPVKDSTKTLVPAVRSVVSVVGGEVISGPMPGIPTSTNRNEEYDPITDDWVTREPLPEPRANLAAGVFDNQIHAIGGRPHIPNEPFDDHLVYNPRSDSWSPLAPLPSPRFDPVVGVVGDKIYAIGGFLETAATGLNQEYTFPEIFFIHRKN